MMCLGSVVKLKSGGPKMVVVDIFENGDVMVAWSNKMEVINRFRLPVRSLIVVTP
jgi:uncharacterized protein YodC (DUF2158 family)